MKSYKIHKRDYTDFSYLLRRVGALNKDGDIALPSYVYWNTKDLNKSKKELIKLFKKEKPYYNKNNVACGVAMYILNLSPSEVRGAALKDGYMLVDDKAIRKESNNE